MKERYELRLDRFDRMRENNPAPDNQNEEGNHYKEAGHTRNVCFVLLDGKQQFFNYAYLVSVLFDAERETNEIILEFTSHTITLKGYRLEELFKDFFDHFPRFVTASDRRYVSAQGGKPVVTDIGIERNGD